MLSWSSNTLATWWEKTLMLGKTEGKRQRGSRRWDGSIASPTQWTWVWANSGRYWRTEKPGMLQSMESQRVGHNLATKQQQHKGHWLEEWHEGNVGIIWEIEQGHEGLGELWKQVLNRIRCSGVWDSKRQETSMFSVKGQTWWICHFFFFLVAQMVKHLPTMRETWVRFLGQEDPLEKEMATYSSSVAWKIPWTEERGRLQSMGSQRVGHDWVTLLTHFLDPGTYTNF